MVVTKTTKRRRTQPDWLVDDYHVLDLTEDAGESEAVSMSEFDSNEEGKESSPNLVSSSFDREFLSDDEDERKLQSFYSEKASHVVKYTRKSRVQGQIPTITDFENQLKTVSSKIVLPVHSIQPATKVERLYVKFSARVVKIRGGDNKKSLVHEWPLENVVGIGVHYRSEWEEDTRASVTVRVSVPLSSFSGSSKRIDEYVLELLKFRESVDDISKLSPSYGRIIEELKTEAVDETLRRIEIQNSPTCTSLFSSSSVEEDVEKTGQKIEMPNFQACTSLSTSSLEESLDNYKLNRLEMLDRLDEAIAAFEVLVYPQGDPDAVTITRKDLKILKPFEFLNDTIIDFYIKYLQQTIVSPEKLKTLYFFNSFFFSKLAEADACGLAAFERVKKWTRKVNVFEKDFVFIPVNQSLHWSLVIICHPGHIWEVPTINGSSDGDACILHLDSMEGCHRGVDLHIKNYLLQEWLERNKDPHDKAFAERFFSGMPFRYSKVPQQDNNCDCGLFLLHYVELFLKTAPSIYRMKRQSSPPTQFLRRNWFKPSEASAKRLVIQKLILELSQGRSLETCRDDSETKENAPNGVCPADEVTRPLSILLRADKQSAAQSTTRLDRVHNDSPQHSKEHLIKNRSPARSEEVELNDDSSRAESSDRQEKHAEVQHADVSIGNRELDDRSRDLHHIASDQSKVSYETGTDLSGPHILVLDDDSKSGPEAVDVETWNYEKCPVPRLLLQVKPLQVPSLVDERVPLYCQPSAVVDLGTQDVAELNDDPSCSLSNEDAREFEKPLDFGSILSPEDMLTWNDDEMYERSYSDAKLRQITSNLQSAEHIRSSSGLSLDSLPGDNLKEDGHIDEGGQKQVRFRNKTSPLGKCSESHMHGALNCRQRKRTEDRVLTLKDTNQPYGFREGVQEIQDLSSDDSSDSSKRWDFKKRSPDLNVRRSSTERGQRVTRSATQGSRGLTMSAEKRSKNDALEKLLSLRNSKRR